VPSLRIFFPIVLCLAASLATCYAQAPVGFTQKSSPANTSLPTNQYAVDLNNDGVPDVIQVLFGNLNSQPQFTVSLANGDGTFKAPVTYTVPEGYQAPLTLASGDFNNDGKVDLVFVTGHGTQLAVYLGNGNGTFQPLKLETIAAPSGLLFSAAGSADWNTVVAADFNHDGKLDLAVQGFVSSGPTGVYLVPGNGNGTFGTARAVYTVTGGEEGAGNYLSIGDFDSDGNADLAFVAVYNCSGAPVAVCSNRVHVLYGNGAFGFANTAPFTTSNLFYFSTGDVDGDGHTDIFGIDVNNELVVLYGQSRTFNLYTMAAPGAFWDAPPSLGDFNGDGKMDIVVRGFDPSTPTQNENKLQFFLQNEPGSFTEQTYTVSNSTSSNEGLNQLVMVGDFNKDTKPDVAVLYGSGVGVSPSVGESIISVLNATSTGNWGGCSYPMTGQGIHVCATSGMTASPVLFSASSNSYGDLRKMELWVDGKKIAEQHHTWEQKAWFNLSSAFATGSHSGTMFASDVDNRLQKTTFSFTVGAAGTCSAPTSPGVNVCKPVNGSTVSSPVQVQAAATITGTLARMEVWVDGVKKYTETSSKTLSTSISLAAGSHRFTVFAVNTAGTKWEGVVNATVK
jgi:hypothetical protein